MPLSSRRMGNGFILAPLNGRNRFHWQPGGHSGWGTEAAAAHDIPSDWWRIPVSGGEPERLTELNLVGLYGDFVGNGRYLAFASRSGLYLLDTHDMSVTNCWT
jgi:hypothetical protein